MLFICVVFQDSRDSRKEEPEMNVYYMFLFHVSRRFKCATSRRYKHKNPEPPNFNHHNELNWYPIIVQLLNYWMVNYVQIFWFLTKLTRRIYILGHSCYNELPYLPMNFPNPFLLIKVLSKTSNSDMFCCIVINSFLWVLR